MCNFASFVLTKNRVYYLTVSDSHEDIIFKFKLDDNKIVRVELLPPNNLDNIQDVSKWKFKVDQDFYPDWTYKKDPTLKEMSRKTLTKRIKEQKIGHIIELGDYEKVEVGHYGTAIVGLKGIATAGDNGKATAGGHGKATAGNYGIATAGESGIATAGDYGTATVGNYGTAIAGYNGIVAADVGGKLELTYYNKTKNRYEKLIAYIGEKGILPDVFYKVQNGKFVVVE